MWDWSSLPLRPALESPYPSDEEVVRRIKETILKKPDWMGERPQILTTQV